MTFLTYSSETQAVPLAGAPSVGGAMRRLLARLLERAERRRQRIAFERLDEHLRRDIGLPARFVAKGPQGPRGGDHMF